MEQLPSFQPRPHHSPRECATRGRSKSGGAGSNSGEEKASEGGLHGQILRSVCERFAMRWLTHVLPVDKKQRK
eukprot:scaffold335_cov142-Skeletonema_menzelii.AAC.20